MPRQNKTENVSRKQKNNFKCQLRDNRYPSGDSFLQVTLLFSEPSSPHMCLPLKRNVLSSN